jgi:hypothetical protein
VTGAVVYRRTQIAWPTIVPLVFVGAVIVPMLLNSDLVMPAWITGASIVVGLLLFATLTVTVTGDGVEAAFGIGLVRKRLMFGDVESFVPVRNSWMHGFGIHYFPGGVVYNAYGFSAVEFKMTTARYVRIGTAEPAALVAVIEQATGRTAASVASQAGRRWGWQHQLAIVLSICALAFAGVLIYFGLQPPTVVVGFDSLYVSNSNYRNTIPYRSMQSLTLESELPRIVMKTNGFSTGRTLRGSFRVDGWGASRLFVNLDAPPFVVIRTADGHVVVNFKEPQRTQALYKELKSHMPGSTR